MQYDEFYSDTFRPTSYVRYKTLTDQELAVVIATLVTEDDINLFRANQYFRYVKDGFFPLFKPRTERVTGAFVDMSIKQCTKMLFLFDQKKPVPVISEVSVKVEIPDHPRNKRPFNAEYARDDYMDPKWCDALRYHEFARYNYEAMVMLQGVEDRDSIFLPYAGIGASVAAACTLGFKNIYVYEPVTYLRQQLEKYPVKFVSGDFACTLTLIHRVLHRDQGIMLHCPYVKVIVCEPSQLYTGCMRLQPVGPCRGFQIATNDPEYRCAGKITFLDNEVATYEQLNPDIIVRFKRYCFIGIRSIPIFNYLVSLDVCRTFQYMTYGTQVDIDEMYIQQPKLEGPILYVVGDMAGLMVANLVDGDAVYSVDVKRELSATYLSTILPVLGMLDVNTLAVLGFPSTLSKIMNAVYVNGMVCSTVETIELEENFPYIMKLPQFVGFKHYTGNQEYSKCVSIEPYIGAFKIVRPLKQGYLKMNALCLHPTISMRCETHVHVYPVRRHVAYPEQTWLFSSTTPILKSLPKFFTLDCGFMELQKMKGHNVSSARNIIDGLVYDVRVKIRDKWVFNPIGRDLMFSDDSEKVLKHTSHINTFLTTVCCLPLVFKCTVVKGKVTTQYVSFGTKVSYVRSDDRYEYVDRFLYEMEPVVDQRVLMCQLAFRCDARFGIMIYDNVSKQLSWVLNFLEIRDYNCSGSYNSNGCCCEVQKG